MNHRSTFLSTEFMTLFAGGGLSIERGINDVDPWVRVASILAFAAVAVAYIVSRTHVKCSEKAKGVG